MSYYIRCPHCGAYLDPGEKCSCREENTTETMNMKSASQVYDFFHKKGKNI